MKHDLLNITAIFLLFAASACKNSTGEKSTGESGKAKSSASSTNATTSPQELFRPGDEAPDFNLKDLAGNPVTLKSLRGKKVILNFWATWCVPCVAEMPALERLSKTLSSEGYEVVAVNVDSPEKTDDVKKFLEENGISFKIPRDPEFVVPQSYGVTGFPESFLVNSEGRIVEFEDPSTQTKSVRVVGDRPWDSPAIIQAVKSALK